MFGGSRAVGAEVEPQEERVREVAQPGSRRGAIEVDERDREAVAKDEVAGREVVVADNLCGGSEWRAGRRIVEAPDQASSGAKYRIRKPRVKLRRDSAIDEREDFPPLRITAQVARNRGEPAALQVPENPANEARVRLQRSP